MRDGLFEPALVARDVPERFPKLMTVWIESGLAWVPFLMQRLDNEFMMRTSDAPVSDTMASARGGSGAGA